MSHFASSRRRNPIAEGRLGRSASWTEGNKLSKISLYIYTPEDVGNKSEIVSLVMPLDDATKASVSIAGYITTKTLSGDKRKPWEKLRELADKLEAEDWKP